MKNRHHNSKSTSRYLRLSQRYFFVFKILGLIIFLICTVTIIVNVIGSKKFLYNSFAIIGRETYIYWKDPKIDFIRLLVVPPDLYIQASGNFGEYPVASLAELDLLSKLRGQLISRSLTDLISLPVDTVIYFKNQQAQNKSDSDEEIVTEFKSYLVPKKWPDIVGHLIYSETSPIQFLRILWQAYLANTADYRIYDLGRSALIRTVSRANGDRIQMLEPEAVDRIVNDDLVLSVIRQENKSLEIYNATGIPGLGERIGKIADHLGLYVASVKNFGEIQHGCQLQTDQGNLDSKSYLILQQLFKCQPAGHDTSQISDFVMIIGKDSLE